MTTECIFTNPDATGINTTALLAHLPFMEEKTIGDLHHNALACAIGTFFEGRIEASRIYLNLVEQARVFVARKFHGGMDDGHAFFLDDVLHEFKRMESFRMHGNLDKFQFNNHAMVHHAIQYGFSIPRSAIPNGCPRTEEDLRWAGNHMKNFARWYETAAETKRRISTTAALRPRAARPIDAAANARTARTKAITKNRQ